jgi:hypothetical protein
MNVPSKDKSIVEPSAPISVEVPVWIPVAMLICEGPSMVVRPRCKACPAPEMLKVTHAGPHAPVGVTSVLKVASNGTDWAANAVVQKNVRTRTRRHSEVSYFAPFQALDWALTMRMRSPIEWSMSMR